MSHSIASLFKMNSKIKAHCLMEMSEREWGRYKYSAIHVSGRVEERRKGCLHIYYEDIIIGGKVSIMKRRSILNGKIYMVGGSEFSCNKKWLLSNHHTKS